MAQRQFPCTQCGASLVFAPGTDALECPYCGTRNVIAIQPHDDEAHGLAEQDYQAYLAEARQEQLTQEVMTVKCGRCAAETTLAPNISADHCGFCGAAIVQTARAQRLIRPQGVLPFKVTDAEAHEAYKDWLRSRWFAPNALKRFARREDSLRGLYLPHWTYDARTDTTYTGQRGQYYYETEHYTTQEDGKTVTRTRQVRKTRWYPARGRVHNHFDDVLVAAGEALPAAYLIHLEPWDLDALVPYADAYLAGFQAESYSVSLERGFGAATQRMAPVIDQSIHQDIGGDTQRILHRDTSYDDITFKHVLLPVWISAYRYRDTVYRFLVNARTGEVYGERPWSWVKITLLVLLVLAVAAILFIVTQQPQ